MKLEIFHATTEFLCGILGGYHNTLLATIAAAWILAALISAVVAYVAYAMTSKRLVVAVLAFAATFAIFCAEGVEVILR